MESQRSLFHPGDYHEHFNVSAYLDHFYSQEAVSEGVKLLLFALPTLASRIPSGGRLLDVGSGPTVYVALCFRNKVDSIVLSDYAEQNCEALRLWQQKAADRFDWLPICKCISLTEGSGEAWKTMEEEARARIEAIRRCDVHEQQLFLESTAESASEFDIVTSVFCLESACRSFSDYCRAMQNVTSRLRPGGFFLLGSVLEDDLYEFGDGNRFTLLFLTEHMILEAMEKAGLDISSVYHYSHDGAYVALARKMNT